MARPPFPTDFDWGDFVDGRKFPPEKGDFCWQPASLGSKFIFPGFVGYGRRLKKQCQLEKLPKCRKIP